jgi:hypothetical protein
MQARVQQLLVGLASLGFDFGKHAKLRAHDSDD